MNIYNLLTDLFIEITPYLSMINKIKFNEELRILAESIKEGKVG